MMEMLYWWKAADPGEFKMGSKEYWQSAQREGQSTVPPKSGIEAASQLMSVRDIMPKPWSAMQMV